MFELKVSKTAKVVLKELQIEDGKIIDMDGVERDLNKIVFASFNEGDVFTFQVANKSDETQTFEEEVSADE